MSWMELGVRNSNLRQAVRAMLWAITWGVAREALGHEPTVEETAEYWSRSVRTTYRQRAAFQKAFPNLASPAPIVDPPAMKNRVQEMAAGFDRLEATVSTHQKRKKGLDLSVIEFGLQPASYP